MVSDDELTMIPMKLTIEKPSGTEISCGRLAAAGYFALDAKSGAFLQSILVSRSFGCRHTLRTGSTHVTRVAMLLIHDIKLETIAQPRAEP